MPTLLLPKIFENPLRVPDIILVPDGGHGGMTTLPLLFPFFIASLCYFFYYFSPLFLSSPSFLFFFFSFYLISLASSLFFLVPMCNPSLLFLSSSHLFFPLFPSSPSFFLTREPLRLGPPPSFVQEGRPSRGFLPLFIFSQYILIILQCINF